MNNKHHIAWDFIKEMTTGNPISFSVEDVKNQGILGNLVRLELHYENNHSKCLFVKFQACSDKTREMKIFNLLQDCHFPFIPKLFHSFEDGTIVLEDLSHLKTKSKNSFCSYNEAAMIVTQLSQIHNTFWNDKRVPGQNPQIFSGVIQYNMEQCWDLYEERYSDQMGQAKEDFIWLWENSLLVSSLYEPDMGTLVHGDLHLENILFSPSEEESHYLIDWQLSGFKTPAFDLSFFLVQSLRSKDRSKWEMTLLEKYYQSLSDSIHEHYSFDRLMLQYRACLTRSMFSSVMMVGPRFSSLSNQMETSDSLASRVISAVKELKPIEAIAELKEIQ